MKTDELSSTNPDEGVIVKCLRFVACKKKLGEGGVIPCNVPQNVMHLMQETVEWKGVETKKQKCKQPQIEWRIDTRRDNEQGAIKEAGGRGDERGDAQVSGHVGGRGDGGEGGQEDEK